jgi:hypothetical protein
MARQPSKGSIMGTLFHQNPRKYRHVGNAELKAFLEDAIRLSQELKIPVSDVIQARKVLELERQNSLYVDNGDAFDEQMGGIGRAVQGLTSAIENISQDD